MWRHFRAQAAVDFMMSYGIALIIIFIAIAVIYQISVLSPSLATQTCTGMAGFSCELFILNKTGTLLLTLSQATGGTITVNGIACSSQPNATGNKPEYGNIYVTNAFPYYPPGTQPATNSPNTGINIFSDSSNTLYLYCYTGTGVAAGTLGDSYTGFIWLNYSVPGYGVLTQEVASLNTRYT